MKRRASGIALCLAAALAAAPEPAAFQTRDQGRSVPAGRAALSGIVLTDEPTPQPVKRAQVTAMNAELTLTRIAVTDDAGRFSIAGLPGGRYTLTATKPAYLRAAYGARRHDGPGTPITLRDGHQMTDITLRMARGAVVSGLITDEHGQPAPGVSVRLMQLRVQNGERTFVPVAASGPLGETTDDRGMYRFFGLPPGEYAVSAAPRSLPGEIRAMTDSEIRAVMAALQQQQQAAQRARQSPGVASIAAATAGTRTEAADDDITTVGYANVYYPGTTSASAASTIVVTAGEERTNVDFGLRLVRTAKVEGTVLMPAGVRPQAVQLMLAPASAVSGAAGLELMSLNRATPDLDGRFIFTAVPPGDYTISARAAGPGLESGPQAVGLALPAGATGAGVARPPQGGELPLMEFAAAQSGSPYWGEVNVTVDGTSISGLTVPMQPGMTMTGRVQFKGTRDATAPDLSRVRLTLAPAPAAGAPRISIGVPMSQVDAAGQFRITGITPGRYRLTGSAPVAPGSGAGQAWTLLSAMAKGRDVLDFLLDIGPNEEIADVVVTFTDTTQEVTGSLQDAQGRPAPDFTIVVFAADRRYWTQPSRRVRSTRPGTDGRFTIGNLPPGDYRIAALTDVSPGETSDPAFLEQLVAASVAFTLAEGERKVQDLRIAGGL